MTDVTAEWVANTFEAVKNWGRWGADDQMGALHYITAQRRARAAATVRDGVTVSCALDFPVVPSIENPVPAQHHMLVAGDALATGKALRQASVEKRFNVGRSSALSPITRAPALRNSGIASAKALALSVQPWVKALG